MQKLTMSKQELKGACNLLLSEDSLTAEPSRLALIASTSVYIYIYIYIYINIYLYIHIYI